MPADPTRQHERNPRGGLIFSPTCARAHAPLVQRASAIASALSQESGIHLLSVNETLPADAQNGARGAIVLQSQADAIAGAQLGRDPAGHFILTHGDAASDAALGALIAAIAASSTRPAPQPIAADATSLSVLALAERLAASEIPVLINGPTGTGKEVLSRFIHDRSPRAGGPFVAVNCAAMPETMLEAMLFGHQKGAFTGATQASEGFFRAADGGTLLLDEIAEMPLALQAKLLRALQEGEVVPIGASQPIKVNVRVLAAANRDLPTEVAEGRFRADLYYRLNVFPLSLAALRDRPDDIAPLAFAMLLRHALADQHPWISEAAIDLLRSHAWPGNVRELENVIRRALLLSGGVVIAPEHIHFDSQARLVSVPAAPEPAADEDAGPGRRRLANIVQRSEAQAIVETLASCGGSRIAAARQLGISERTLRYRLAAFRSAGIDVDHAAGSRAAADWAPLRAAGMR